MADQPFFRVHRSALLPAMDAVFEAVDTRATIPILGNVLLSPVNGELTLRATDLAIEVETSCELLDEGTQQALTVSGADLRDIVKNLPENAEITFGPGGFPDQLRIQSGRSRFTLLTLPEKDFPSIAKKVAGEKLSLEIVPLIDAFMKVLYAIKDDKVRAYLSGACMHPHNGDHIAIVGCDGHNLAVVRIPAGQTVDFPSIILPIKTTKALKKLFGEKKGRADVTISDALICISMGGVKVISKLVDGVFPGYINIIPTHDKPTATATVASFRGAVQRVCLVANDLDKDTVRLQLDGKVMRVAMKTSSGEDAAEDLAVDYSGEPVDIGFSGRYLTAMLSSINTQDVEMRFLDHTMPGLFRPTIDCDESYVINVRKL